MKTSPYIFNKDTTLFKFLFNTTNKLKPVFSLVYFCSVDKRTPLPALHFYFPHLRSHLYITLLFAGSPLLDHNINASYRTTGSKMLEPKPQPVKNMSRPLMEVPPSGSKMPPLEYFKLTKELVEKRVKDNVIVVTFGNYAFMDFILTWVKHLTDLHVDNILVGKYLCQNYISSCISERLIYFILPYNN